MAFLHKTRQNIIQQRIQRTNALGSSLHEFGYIVKVSKAKLITECGEIVNSALKDGYISDDVAQEMLKDCKEIKDLQHREKEIDAKIADMVINYLQMHGYRTHAIADGAEAIQSIQHNPPDLLLLDLLLKNTDGITVCKEVRTFSTLPIIMVTARVNEIDRLLGLEVGADDYVCKPFSPRELVARVKAQLRRSLIANTSLANSQTEPPQTKPLHIHKELQCVQWHGQALPLTPVEYRILALFMGRPHHIFSRSRLLDHLHQEIKDVSDRAIDSHIKNLRRKLTQAAVQDYSITSVYGVGYRFETPH